MAELTEREKKDRKRAIKAIQKYYKEKLGIDLKYTQALRVLERALEK